MIKVLHVVSCMNRAGEETFIMNIYRHIDRSKVQFCFLCSQTGPADYDQEIYNLGGEIYYLPTISKSLGPFSYFKEIMIRAKWFADNRDKFDLVHVHTYHALNVLIELVACRFAGVKKVIVHSHNTQAPHIYLHKFCRALSHLYNFRKFACGIAAGKWLFGEKTFNKGEVYIVPNGIDTKKFIFNEKLRHEYRQMLGIDGKIVLGHIGRFDEQKNHSFLLNIFKAFHLRNNNSVLLLIGRGKLQKYIKQKVEEKGLSDSVIFLGVRNDIPALISAMDVFVFPSLYEGLSVCSIEVQCNGLPIVTSDIPSMKEANIAGCMMFCSLTDSADVWADKISSITQYDRISFMQKILDKGYDISHIASKLQESYLSYVLNLK